MPRSRNGRGHASSTARGSAKEIDDVAARRSALRGLLSAERFAELQKQVAAEISFLRADAQHRLERAAAAAAEARQARRRTERTARMLLEALERSGRTVPDDVRRGLHSGGEQAPAAITAAFGLLSASPAGGGTTERQRELASKLGRDEKRGRWRNGWRPSPRLQARKPVCGSTGTWPNCRRLASIRSRSRSGLPWSPPKDRRGRRFSRTAC